MNKEKPNEGLLPGQRVKFIYNRWGNKEGTPVEIEKYGTFLRYSNGIAYKRKLVIKFDDSVQPKYLGTYSKIIPL